MRCWNCMQEIEGRPSVCPLCGFPFDQVQTEVYHLPPETVLAGRYELGIVLGFGGFGVVYKAWDNKLQRIVAVKEYFPTMLLYRDTATGHAMLIDQSYEEYFVKGKEEFLDEARNIAKFNNHPNIVHVFDFFEENGTAYFIMEYMDGLPLNVYIKMGKERGEVITVECAVHIAKAVLNALEAAHAEGIIHRDIKPHNIYIKADGKVKLIDFGAARFSDSELEKTRSIIITPGYAPAEQYESKSIQGPFTDIYALGAVLYQMVTGVKPQESVNRKVIDEVVPPSELNSKVPDELDKVIMRAIAVKPEIRFKTAAEFKKALSKGKSRSAEAEIKRLKLRRVGVTAAVILAVLGVACYALWNVYMTAYYERSLMGNVTLKVWAPYIDNDLSTTTAIYDNMSAEYKGSYTTFSLFGTTFSGIKLEYTFFPEAEYVQVLKNALAAGNGPDVFDTTLCRNELTGYIGGADMVYDDMKYEGVDFSIADNYYFLGEDNYKTYFTQTGFIPLTWDAPLVYSNANEDEEEADTEENTVNGTVMDYGKMQDSMEYMNVSVQSNAGGEFKNCWSINNASSKRKKYAAARLIRYFLHEVAEQDLIQLDMDGEEAGIQGEGSAMPINRTAWSNYTVYYSKLSVLEDQLEALSMK